MYKAVGYNSLGETLLINTLSSAYYAITKHDAQREGYRIKEGRECLAFVQNSGVHQIITIFGLSLNPDKVQELFFYYVEVA